jgi:hypothetical protein
MDRLQSATDTFGSPNMQEMHQMFGGGTNYMHFKIPCLGDPGRTPLHRLRKSHSQRNLSVGKSHDHARTTSKFYDVPKKTHSKQRPEAKDGEFYITKHSNFTAHLMLKSPISTRSHSFKFWKTGNMTSSLSSNFQSTGDSNFQQQALKIAPGSHLFSKKNVFFTEGTQGNFIKPDLITTRNPKNRSVTNPY